MMEVTPRFFSGPTAFRKWLEKNHDQKNELLVGLHKKNSGKKTLTYAEALDEALCFGWIDGVRKNFNEISYTIRFTPRKPKSIWSRINVNHVERLKKEGRMMPAGLAAFAKKEDKRTGIYSFEKAPREFPAKFLKNFRTNKEAWKFFSAQPPGYRRLVVFWVVSAKREETQLRRLEHLIKISANGERLGLLGEKKKSA
ncbi:MAG TPA: YdeI/OmpD-associated family protein [Pyrinomonadaceae bacterium]|nr:YdeI/OmpD-associated family protein [Pyrinomonadaceae bacterium]